MSYRVRRMRRNEDHGVDDWLMTYADMITLLVCFFAVFLSVSVPKKEIFDAAREKVKEQFSSQQAVSNSAAGTASDSSTATPFKNLPSIIDKFHAGEGGSGFDEGNGPDVNKGFKKEPEGDRIKTIEMPSAAFFASGSASLSAEGGELLQKVLDTQLNSADVKGFMITVEGHTDDAPIKTTQFPSNWELSAGRAAAVVRYFIEHGVEPQRLRATAYADSIPKVPNRDAAGKPIPENQAQNRRVVIKLEKVVKAD